MSRGVPLGRLLLAALLLVPLAQAEAANGTQAEPCISHGASIVCEWTLRTLDHPNRTTYSFDVPVFPATHADVSVAFEGTSRGWIYAILDTSTGEKVMSQQESHDVGSPVSGHVSHTHFFRAHPDRAHTFTFDTRWFPGEGEPIPLSRATASNGEFRIRYEAYPLPIGTPASRPAATREDPHLLDAARDAGTPATDLLAAWMNDPVLGDGVFSVHFAVRNLTDDGERVNPAEYLTYRLTFHVHGLRYTLHWIWDPYDHHLTCYLDERKGDEDQRRKADPLCSYDLQNHTLTAEIMEVEVGAPAPETLFEDWHARALRWRRSVEPRTLLWDDSDPDYTPPIDELEDDAYNTRFAFALGGPEQWARLRTGATTPPGTATSEGTTALGGLPHGVVVPAALGLLALGLVLGAASLRQAGRRQDLRTTAAVAEEETRLIQLRRREIYRAALERMLDDRLLLSAGRLRELDDLRQRLGLPDAEHESILREVRDRLTTGLGGDVSEPAPIGSLVLGRYRVVGVLGEGGGGRTYRCEDPTLGRDVAVKEIDARHDPQVRWHALNEARALARFQHPNVVTIHDAHEVDGIVYIVMEYVAGGSLAHSLRDGPLPGERAARVLRDVLEGLAALHAAHLLHRDVKPSNVLLTTGGRAKLADLGVARALTMTTVRSLARAGTPAYMAPEQVLDTTIDERTDLYAAAALLYEMLAGAPYVRVAMREGVLVEEAIVSRPPPLPVRGAPDWANAFLTVGLAKDPDRRPASATDALRLVPDPQ